MSESTVRQRLVRRKRNLSILDARNREIDRRRRAGETCSAIANGWFTERFVEHGPAAAMV
jgi:hypothetical protein